MLVAMFVRTAHLFVVCLSMTLTYTQDMRSFKMKKLDRWRFGCAKNTCSPFQTFITKRLFDCQKACLSQIQCNALSFGTLNSHCSLFNNAPAPSGSSGLPDANIVTMFTIAGTRVPSGQYNHFKVDAVIYQCLEYCIQASNRE
jgi:hypothetical protein